MSIFSELPPEQLQDAEWLYDNMPYTGELLMGHLRYGTHGDNSIETCHPFLRQNNWITRNLVLAGNFNMTNVDELFNELVELGAVSQAAVGHGDGDGKDRSLPGRRGPAPVYLVKSRTDTTTRRSTS